MRTQDTSPLPRPQTIRPLRPSSALRSRHVPIPEALTSFAHTLRFRDREFAVRTEWMPGEACTVRGRVSCRGRILEEHVSPCLSGDRFEGGSEVLKAALVRVHNLLISRIFAGAYAELHDQRSPSSEDGSLAPETPRGIAPSLPVESVSSSLPHATAATEVLSGPAASIPDEAGVLPPPLTAELLGRLQTILGKLAEVSGFQHVALFTAEGAPLLEVGALHLPLAAMGKMALDILAGVRTFRVPSGDGEGAYVQIAAPRAKILLRSWERRDANAHRSLFMSLVLDSDGNLAMARLVSARAIQMAAEKLGDGDVFGPSEDASTSPSLPAHVEEVA